MEYPGIFRGKINDIIELRNELELIWETKTREEISNYGILLIKYMQEEYLKDYIELCNRVIQVNMDWQEKKVHFQKGRDLSGEINAIAKTCTRDKDLALRVIANIAAIPHTKLHGMWASDYMVKVVNEIYPKDLRKVSTIRKLQIELIKKV